MSKEIGDLFHTQLEGDVEFGYDAVDAAVGFDWGEMIGGAFKVVGKLWGPIKKLFKSGGKDKKAKDELDATKPGAGDAATSAIQLILAATQGNPTALAQIKGIADAAKGGDATKKPAHDLLQVINAARKQVIAEVGAAKRRRRKQARRGQQRRPASQPVTQSQVANAMRRLPPQQRPALAGMIQQAQLRGVAPIQQFNQPTYGTPAYYAWMQAQQGYPYGMAGSLPFGAGAPALMQAPYGGMYAGDAFLEQAGYYGDADEELAAAFAGDEEFPDEGLAGENAIVYQG